MSNKKDKWFGVCNICQKDGKKLSTVNMRLNKVYNIWLVRCCDSCRVKTLSKFYDGLAQCSTTFQEISNLYTMFKKELKEELEK